MKVAKFNENHHAVREGWATYHNPPGLGTWWQRLICRVAGHRSPVEVPEHPNGYSPSCYTRCSRCSNWLGWYVLGQHRYGGLNADVWASYEAPV